MCKSLKGPSPITIKLINKNNYIVYQTSDGKYYQGSIKRTNENKLIIQPIMNNDLSDNKYRGHYFEKPADYNTQKTSALDNFVNGCDNVMSLVGAGSSISDKLEQEARDNDQTKNDSNKYKNGLTMNDLADNINGTLANDPYYFNLIEMAKMSGFYKDKKLDNSQMKDKAFDNFEDLLSNITSFKKFLKVFCNDNGKIKKYERTFDEIRRLIYKYCNLKYNDRIFRHADFINVLMSLSNSDERLKIYSTNYDTLFEQAASSDNLFVIDGFDYSTHRMFKNNAFNIDFVNRQNDSEEMNTSNTSLLPNVIKIFQLHGSVAWYKDSDGAVHKANPSIVSKKLEDDINNNCMIFPGKHKYEQSYDDPYFDMFFQFQRDLHKKNTLLVVLGFSFGDMHIRRMVHDAIQVNSSLNMVFVSFEGLKAKIVKSQSKKGELIITIDDPNISYFCNMNLLSHELFISGNMGQFVDTFNLGNIYNR